MNRPAGSNLLTCMHYCIISHLTTSCRALKFYRMRRKTYLPSFKAQNQVTTFSQTSTSLPIPIPISIDILLRILSLPLPMRDQRLAVILAIRQPVDRVDMTFRRRSVGQED